MRQILLLTSLLMASSLPAMADTIQYEVNGTIGTDILSGVITYDSSLPADGLAAVYTSLSLTLTGSQLGVGGIPITATYSSIFWPPLASQPPYYGLFSQADGFNPNGFTGYSDQLNLYIGSDNGPGLPPTSIGSTPFIALVDQQFFYNGVAENDNEILGQAYLTPLEATSLPSSWTMMSSAFALFAGLVLFRRKSVATAR